MIKKPTSSRKSFFIFFYRKKLFQKYLEQGALFELWNFEQQGNKKSEFLF